MYGVRDPRASGFSQLLRTTHLDKLLQLENVENGDMVLSGGSRPLQSHTFNQFGFDREDDYACEWRNDYDTFPTSIFGFSALYRHCSGLTEQSQRISMAIDMWYWHYAASPQTDFNLIALTPIALAIQRMPDIDFSEFEYNAPLQ